jgi:DNA topoisomerase-1
MDIAQKLYEGGHITYMRTDSTNLSQEAISGCKKYIVDKYSEKYSKPTNYTSSKNAQEAHEAIRPTHIDKPEIETSDKDQAKLYNLIWKRTVASQMCPATLNIQTISIDTLNDNKSILPKKTYWISTYQSVIFDGFLILYDNSSDEESNEEPTTGKVEIKINNILKFIKIKIAEEFNKLPLRFNEANLVKFLEKNNIGRPSTYASIINKIIERQYVEIKDVTGIQKVTNIIELDKKYTIKESTKDVIIGKENKKILPTELGIKITQFLEDKFNNIMQIDFTSDFETYLDKIADGKAKWYNVLDNFYKMFSPIVEELNKTVNSDKLLGINPSTGQEIFIGAGKYGPYIKTLENDKNKFYSIENIEINLEDALKVLEYPKVLGKINKTKVELAKGKFGIYIKYNKVNYAIPTDIDVNTIDLDKAKDIINKKSNNFTIKDKIVNVKNGQYGYYLQITDATKKIQNIPIPKDIDVENINLKNILEIIANKNGTIKKNI